MADGKILTPYDMNRKQIINILNRLHRSRPFDEASWAVWDIPWNTSWFVRSWQQEVPEILKQNHHLNSVIGELGKTVPGFREDHATIVHGDLRHSNWLRQRVGLVYLVDWDSVRLTDRMFDVAHLLRHHIPDHQWRQWLRDYGYKYNQTVLDELYWYGQYSSTWTRIANDCENQDLDNVNREIYALRCLPW